MHHSLASVRKHQSHSQIPALEEIQRVLSSSVSLAIKYDILSRFQGPTETVRMSIKYCIDGRDHITLASLRC